MAKLKLKGIQNLYDINRKEAEEVLRIFKEVSYNPNQKINIGQLSFEKRDIALIDMGEGLADMGDFAEKYRQWNDYWLGAVKQSPENKAKNSLEKFKMTYWGITGQEPDAGRIEKAETSMRNWFEKNPNYTFPDMREIIDLEEYRPEVHIGVNAETMKNQMRKTTLQIMENCIAEDITKSRYHFGKDKVELVVAKKEFEPDNDEIRVEDIPF